MVWQLVLITIENYEHVENIGIVDHVTKNPAHQI